MIDNYSFIDANSSGNKEAFISGNKVGFNKLSANETNLIKDKLNEIIGQVNLNQIPLYPNFSLKLKGENNIMLNQLQVGDIVHGFYDANTIWTNARYNGGDVTDKANYTNLDEGIVTKIEKFSVLYSGSSTFTLPTFAQIIEVSVNGWSTENYTTPNDTTVIINEAINTGQQVVILYLVDENLNIAPYYTQAQVDALIASVGGGGSGSVAEGEFIASDLNLTAIVNVSTILFTKAIYTDIGKTRTIYLSMYVTPTATGGCAIRLDLVGLLANFNGNLVGSGTARSGIGNYSACTVQYITGSNANITFKAVDTNQQAIYLTITYKTT